MGRLRVRVRWGVLIKFGIKEECDIDREFVGVACYVPRSEKKVEGEGRGG